MPADPIRAIAPSISDTDEARAEVERRVRRVLAVLDELRDVVHATQQRIVASRKLLAESRPIWRLD
jgi:ABC-type transport system involved in cytochrome c biogenesis ATPase subunit